MVQPSFLLTCKTLWYVKLAQLKVQLLNEEDRRENTLLGGRREGFFFCFVMTSTHVHNVFLGHLTRRNFLVKIEQEVSYKERKGKETFS
jgi:hypothetical protein